MKPELKIAYLCDMNQLYLCNGKRCKDCDGRNCLTTEEEFAIRINGEPIKFNILLSETKEVENDGPV